MDTPLVLVVGAGPVGLTAALCLARFGVRVRIIDSNDGPTNLSKALVLWRRTLLTLDAVVPVQHFVARGGPVQGARFYNEGRAVTELAFTGGEHTTVPGVLIPQSEVEAVLIEALRARGVTVERNTTLAGFTAGDPPIRCTLTTPHGTEEIDAQYLIGCDGAHSTVRHALGLSFDGHSLDRRWLLGDVDVTVRGGAGAMGAAGAHATPGTAAAWEHDIEPGWVYVNSSGHGALAIFPFQSGRCRIIADAGAITPGAPQVEPTLADLQAIIDTRTRLQWSLPVSHWLADFHVNERQVAEYVHGTVVLAGDAAHVHSPAGGQGMNTGMQDAANLAWKVAVSLDGQVGPALLATYQWERHPVAARVLSMTGRMLRAAMVRNAVVRQARNTAMAVALAVPAVRRRLTSALCEDDVHYPDSPLAGTGAGAEGATPGNFFPDVPVRIDRATCSSIELLRGLDGTLGTLVLLEECNPADWPTRCGVRSLGVCRVGPGGDALDDGGALRDALGLRATQGVLVRPDGIIAASGDASAAHEWVDAHMGGAAHG